jgi:hypothetical protein
MILNSSLNLKDLSLNSNERNLDHSLRSCHLIQIKIPNPNHTT